MKRRRSRVRGSRAATRADVVASAVAIGGLVLVLGLGHVGEAPAPFPVPDRVLCQFRLQQLGQGAMACMQEHNGFSPTKDDGPASGPSWIMLTWADLLYDLNYITDPRWQLCPADAHPDPATEERGDIWGFWFVDQFGVNETPRPGVRTSYALNSVVSFNWPEDRYVDASRQVYAIDGWWTWFACLNAAWLYADEVFGMDRPVDWPNWQATMVGWRHGSEHGANALFLDGSVRFVTPIVPADMQELLHGTFDTEDAFTWLPGEQTIRYDNEEYDGSHPEWLHRLPALACYGYGWCQDPDLPNELDATWRSEHNAWVKLPNPADRP